MFVVDHAIVRGCAHTGAAEDVGGGGGAEDGFAQEAAGVAVDFVRDPFRQLGGVGDCGARRGSLCDRGDQAEDSDGET